MLRDGECQRLIGKLTGEFIDHTDLDKLAPKSCPEEISQLVDWDLLFKIDRTMLSPSAPSCSNSTDFVRERCFSWCNAGFWQNSYISNTSCRVVTSKPFDTQQPDHCYCFLCKKETGHTDVC